MDFLLKLTNVIFTILSFVGQSIMVLYRIIVLSFTVISFHQCFKSFFFCFYANIAFEFYSRYIKKFQYSNVYTICRCKRQRTEEIRRRTASKEILITKSYTRSSMSGTFGISLIFHYLQNIFLKKNKRGHDQKLLNNNLSINHRRQCNEIQRMKMTTHKLLKMFEKSFYVKRS